MRKTLPEMRCEFCLVTLQSTEQHSSTPESHFPKQFPCKYYTDILGKAKCRNIFVQLSVNLTLEHWVLSLFHRTFSPPLDKSSMKFANNACPGWCCVKSFSKSLCARRHCHSEFLTSLRALLRYWWESHKDVRPASIDPYPSLGFQPNFPQLKRVHKII